MERLDNGSHHMSYAQGCKTEDGSINIWYWPHIPTQTVFFRTVTYVTHPVASFYNDPYDLKLALFESKPAEVPFNLPVKTAFSSQFSVY